VERFHGLEASEAAERHFDRLHKEHLPPEELEEAVIEASDGDRVHLPAVLADHFGLSRSEARRLLGQGGVRLNGEPLGEEDLDVDAERLQDGVLQVGRRRFKRIRVAS
jgi:tyrosyl-tRNA synthetase